MKMWSVCEADAQPAEILGRSLPSAIMDMHAHLYRTDTLSVPAGSFFSKGPDEVDVSVWRENLGRLVGQERLSGALFLPVPFVPRERIDEVNAWIMGVVDGLPQCKTLALVAPGMDRSQVEPLVSHPGFAGFKPYHTYSTSQPTFDSPPGDYVPEWAWEMAQEHSLIITLHLVRSGAMADPDNISYLQTHCRKYPGARVVLAHAGRSFHGPNAGAGSAALCGLPNLYFDLSAICEAEPLMALIDAFGPRKLMWGSDFPVSQDRSRAVTVGDGFYWLGQAALDAEKGNVPCSLWPVGLESMRALLAAAEHVGLDKADLEDVFCRNAQRLLGFLPEFEDGVQALYRRAKERIPGGTQLLSKRPEMLAPDQWPAYFREARGCETWDTDGRHYFDMSTNGIGACLLGFRDPDVTRAVKRRITLGSMCTLNAPEEVELADLLCEIHPWADQVRYARAGGEECAIAVRIARATTDRSIVAICGYSGWQDWYLAANLGESDALRGHLLSGLNPLGVPRELRGTAVTFATNDREAFQSIIDTYGDRLAAVVMEPCRVADPEPGFLEFVRDGAHRVGALLIFDEVSVGWRLHLGGAHLKFGVFPDIAVFAKAMGNGHPMAAVIGTRQAMAGAHESFISSTYWTESVGPVAALATIRKMQTIDVPAHVARIGSRVQRLWENHGRAHALPVHVGGYPCIGHFSFDHPQSSALRTLYTQLMLDRGFLAGAGFYPTLAHTDEIVDRYGEAIDAVFGEIARTLESGDDVSSRLRGPVAHSGFQRLTG